MIDGEQLTSPNPSKGDLEEEALELAGNIFSYIYERRPGYEISRNMENFRSVVSEYYKKEKEDTKQKQRVQDLHRTLDKYVQAYTPEYENKGDKNE